MRILFLSDIDSSHTRKWATSLAARGYEVGIFSLRKSESGWFYAYPSIRVFDDEGFGKEKFKSGSTSKLGYLKLLPFLRDSIQSFHPDIVHAHYATSYGLLGARTGFHPFVISVWGSDIFEFPKSSWLSKRLVVYNLNRADRIFSTSHVMKTEIHKYVSHPVDVTPFGVDTHLFSRKEVTVFPGTEGAKIVGTIKSLERKYGINVLIEAFAIVKKQFEEKVKLVIAGSGTMEHELRQITRELLLEDDVIFAGHLNAEQVPEWHNRIDVFANLSLDDSESFGVSVVEAMACERPVVVTSVGGLTEVVVENESGLVVPPNIATSAADAILRLLNNSELALKLGKAGRQRVLAVYDWEKNLDEIEKLYAAIVRK